MIVVDNPAHRLHDGGMEMHRGGLVPCYEMPSRADFILAALREAGHPVRAPDAFPDDALLAVHDEAFVAFLRGAWARWTAAGHDGFMLPSAFPARALRRDVVPDSIHGAMGWWGFDTSTPMVAGTWAAARGAADAAMTAASLLAAGERAAYALCRPPGHHAGRATYGGYCFLNNAALAVERLRAHGRSRVAVLVVDFHHGNGTQDIFWRRGDVLFVSIHGDPRTEYPWFLGHADERGEGDGAGTTLNLPLPRGTAWPAYERALGTALDAIAAFGAEALVVSLGVDTFEHDPISAFALGADCFPRLGARLAALGLPTVLVQEGGYAVAEVGHNVAAVVAAFARA